MKYYFNSDNNIIIKRHIIILFYPFAKFAFALILILFLYFISITFLPNSWDNVIWNYIKTIDFVFILILLNYSFFSLIFAIISYYNNIIIIWKDNIIQIKCTLFLQNDIEVIDSYRIVKVDSFSHGIIANTLWYGEIIIEQQKNEVKTFHFIPNTYNVLNIIKKQRENILSEPQWKEFYKSN